MIRVGSLQFEYDGTPVLRDVSFTVPRGTTYAIVGPSGCGKSTLLHLLAGLHKPTRGTISVDGVPLASPRDGTAIIFQDGGLFPWKSAIENAALGLVARGVPGAEARTRAMKTLEDLGVGHRSDAYPAAMSGGEVQRTALTRALVLEPDLLLMDEPAASLDAIARERIQDLVLKQFSDRDLTIVVVTHNIEEAVAFGQRIAVTGGGEILDEIDNRAFEIRPQRTSAIFVAVCDQVRRRLTEVDGGG